MEIITKLLQKIWIFIVYLLKMFSGSFTKFKNVYIDIHFFSLFNFSVKSFATEKKMDVKGYREMK